MSESPDSIKMEFISGNESIQTDSCIEKKEKLGKKSKKIGKQPKLTRKIVKNFA